MERPLSGKVALVTGASKGIGAAIAKRLAADGAALALHYGTDRDGAEAVATEIERAGGKAWAIGADLADMAQAEALFDRVTDGFGRPDILVNNAGTGRFANLADLPAAEVAQVLAVNALAPILLARAAARSMAPGGRIVNLGSVITDYPVAGRAAYAASKGALHAFTQVLAQELGPRGITVNAVAPGVTATDRFKRGDASRIPEITARTALGRIGTPEDIASIVAWLCGPDAAWVTGEVIRASGGLRGL